MKLISFARLKREIRSQLNRNLSNGEYLKARILLRQVSELTQRQKEYIKDDRWLRRRGFVRVKTPVFRRTILGYRPHWYV